MFAQFYKITSLPLTNVTLIPNQFVNLIHCEHFCQQKEEVIERWKQADVQLVGSHFLHPLTEEPFLKIKCEICNVLCILPFTFWGDELQLVNCQITMDHLVFVAL